MALDMQRLSRSELDAILELPRGPGGGGIGPSSGATWLEKLEDKNGLSRMANTRYLLHGTKEKNLPTIFKHGLRAVYAREKDNLYGKGVYFSDSSCKVHQYTDRNGPGGDLYIFICRVVLGRPLLLKDTQTAYMSAPDGYHSCRVNSTTKHGLGGTYLFQLHNEYVVYNDIECFPEFLLTVRDNEWHQ